MNVLSIDTVSPVIGVGLRCGDDVRERVVRQQRGAEALLIPWARDLCAEAGIAVSALDGIAVAHGPGAFTGIRVGLATAVGLALGLGVPLWAASSLDTRAARAARHGLPVLVLLDARKERVYTAWYPEGVAVQGPADIAPEKALAWARTPFVAVGEGALAWRALVEAHGGRIPDDAEHPAVDALCRMGEEGLRRGEGRDPIDVAPFYLRAPDAGAPG